jgi:hypothetical protein
MIIECRGWEIESDNRLNPRVFSQEYQITIDADGTAECNKEEKCPVCPLNIGDIKLRCPGVSLEGGWQSFWTVYFVSRIDDKITCQASWKNECPWCWLRTANKET